jgi:hypothetical protein
MADASFMVALIAQVLQNDDILSGLADFVIPGFNRHNADESLKGPHQACIGVRNFQSITEALPGCYFHSGTEENDGIEFHVIHISDNDVYAHSIVARIKDLLKAGLYCTFGGVNYRVRLLNLTFNALNDDQFTDRIQIIGTCRLKYLDS